MADRYRFKALGPFRVPKTKPRVRWRIDCYDARDEVFDAADEAIKGDFDVRDAIGCYVFGLSPAGSARVRPYYVGKACDQPLYKRVFQPIDKPDLYDEILNWFKSATPYVYLLPLLTPSGNLARLGTNRRRIELAEHTLIGRALHSNPDLWNVQHRAALDSFFIDGLPGASGKQSKPAVEFGAMFERNPPKRSRNAAGGQLPSPAYAQPEEDAGQNEP